MRMGLRNALYNGVAASPFVSRYHRWRVLRWLGLDVERCTIEPGLIVGGTKIHIGEDVYINRLVILDEVGQISIGDHTMIGPRVTILTSNHSIVDEYRPGPSYGMPVDIGSGCWIGASATILPGVTVGDGCVVAAGAVVTTDCEPNGLYAGVPAVRKRELPPRSTDPPSDALAAYEADEVENPT